MEELRVTAIWSCFRAAARGMWMNARARMSTYYAPVWHDSADELQQLQIIFFAKQAIFKTPWSCKTMEL